MALSTPDDEAGKRRQRREPRTADASVPSVPFVYPLRDATTNDIDALLALERACYPSEVAWGRAEYRPLLAHGVCLVDEVDGTIVGFIGAFTHRGWSVGNVATVNVRPDARRRGVGARLLAACEARLREAGMLRVLLEVNVANADAIRLYERAGYARLRRIADYYAEGYAEKDAFAYAKELDEKRGAPGKRSPPGQPRSHG